MSNYLAIATVTATLTQSLDAAVRRAVPGAHAWPSRPDSQDTRDASAGVHIFLYQVTPNAALRNVDLPMRSSNGAIVRRPLVALDLHYLMTFYGKDLLYEPQRMLGSVVSQLHARPLLSRDLIRRAIDSDPEGVLAASDLTEQVQSIACTELPLSLEELTKIWSVFFQTPYALSVAYQATAVLIESDDIPQAPLPVLERRAYALSFMPPTIEPTSVRTELSTIGGQRTLVLEGRGLSGANTLVRIGEHDLEPATVTNSKITLDLSAQRTRRLRAGVQSVQVVQQRLLGDPPVPHKVFSSNVAAFVLEPLIDVPPTALGQCDIQVSPAVGREQYALLLLSRLNAPGEEPLSYSIRADAFKPNTHGVVPAESDTLTFQLGGVLPGEYLARVQVDRAESSLIIDAEPDSPTFGQYSKPTIEIL